MHVSCLPNSLQKAHRTQHTGSDIQFSILDYGGKIQVFSHFFSKNSEEVPPLRDPAFPGRPAEDFFCLPFPSVYRKAEPDDSAPLGIREVLQGLSLDASCRGPDGAAAARPFGCLPKQAMQNRMIRLILLFPGDCGHPAAASNIRRHCIEKSPSYSPHNCRC